MTEPKIPNATEAAEHRHLSEVRSLIHKEAEKFDEVVRRKHREAVGIKKYLNVNKGDMDHAEKISTRSAADQATLLTDHAERRRAVLQRLVNSPYFGRIDFQAEDSSSRQPFYIGIHSFYDEETESHLVYDWRAPVSSMFYHYETGPAGYDTPEARVDGEVLLKRQFRIADGEMEFMLETSMNIHDDVLQRELSRSADDKMKNIVATIQRDQNSIIRDEETQALVIQGAAGSGKTSIALHRIAYLLYKFKDTLRSEDILIVSPNKVFAHYISRVLPELGEEMIREISMEELAESLAGPQVVFQTFAEEVAKLLENNDPLFEERILLKAEPEFLEKLEEYARLLHQDNVVADDLEANMTTLPASWVAAEFKRHRGRPFSEQLSAVTDAAVLLVQDRYAKKLINADRTKIRNQLKKMLRYSDIHEAYAGFFDFTAEFELLKRDAKGKYEWSDVFPLIYLRLMLEGSSPDLSVKHLVIDEMQDYSAVQYRVLSMIYPCRKTILGDSNQAVSPLSSSDSEIITKMIHGARSVSLHKSYRSTLEITRFSLRVRPNPDIVPVERHGDEPLVQECRDDQEQIAHLVKWLRDFLKSDHQSLGLICKTQKHAEAIYEKLTPLHDKIHLLDASSTNLDSGIILSNAHLVKGLEFDEVIVPDVDADHYRTSIDRQMLYVGCTRAMHLLRLTHVGEASKFLTD